jgi:hypothetical protein
MRKKAVEHRRKQQRIFCTDMERALFKQLLSSREQLAYIQDWITVRGGKVPQSFLAGLRNEIPGYE